MLTLVSLLKQHALKFPDKKAYVVVGRNGHERESITYSQLQKRTDKIATNLIDEVNPGNRVCLIIPNGIQFIESFFSALKAGAVPVVLQAPNAIFLKRSRARIEAIQKSLSAKICLSTEEVHHLLDSNQQFEKTLILERIIEKNKRNVLELEVKDESTALIQFTSGSTSKVKGVALTHKQIITNLAAICEQTQTKSECKLVTWLPPSHDMGLIGGLLVPFFAGGTSYILETMDFLRSPLSWLKAISFYQATCAPAPSFAYDLCSQSLEKGTDVGELNLKSWVVAYNGAEPVRSESIKRFQKNFSRFGFRADAMYPCYGLAEGTLMVTGPRKRRLPKTVLVDRSALAKGKVVLTDLSNANATEIVSCGEAVQELKIRIVSEGRLCNELELGEIIIHGPSVARKYEGENEEIEFLNTHDFGFLFENELYILGRTDDTFIVRAEKYQAEELESTITNSDPLLQDLRCAVIGANEESSVQILCEIEVPKMSSRVYKDDIQKKILKCVGEKYLLKAQVQFVKKGALVKTSSGKLNRKANQTLWVNHSE